MSKFPPTNKMFRQPIPERVRSTAKILEEHVKQVNWAVFRKAYLYILGYVLLTVFGLITTVGIAKFLVSLL